MKTKLFCFLVAALFAACNISAQEHIQIKTESAVRNGGKFMDITITNTSDKNMRILFLPRGHNINIDGCSRFNLSLLDNNKHVVNNYIAMPLARAIRSGFTFGQPIDIKPHSSKELTHYDFEFIFNCGPGTPKNIESVKWFTVAYLVFYELRNEDNSVVSTHQYKKTTDPIAF